MQARRFCDNELTVHRRLRSAAPLFTFMKECSQSIAGGLHATTPDDYASPYSLHISRIVH
ncbi:hypothetical protein LQV63_03765 [Paenibacillus profundus]|uniref:Uncharacterized protein n=1 Tax=Paenibacillus profundus TaxID=1173085 RepID=A0ABS8Y9B2_9BACL|nr:hypothetical protein [Paenibacillus profundus]